MIILFLALIGALIIMAILSIGRLVFGRKEAFTGPKVARWFIGYFIFNFIICLAVLYFGQPAFTGPFNGWQWLLGPLVFSSILNLFAVARPIMSEMAEGSTARYRDVELPANVSRGAIAAGIFGLMTAIIIGIVISGLIVVFTTWFDTNAKALASLPKIRTEKSSTLPPTDPNHIVLVSKSVASYEGQQVLGSNGQNLGSTYSIDPNNYALQSINRHLYYVAPLSYNNIFVNLSSSTTPGFVVVDAENPQATQPVLHTEANAAIAYLPGALLNQDLLRHVYLSGYTYGKLTDPTLEVDDSYHPYWTISILQPTRGYTGDQLDQVLLVDAHTGNIKAYKPQDVPKWVDRVMPSSTVDQYLSWWGLYHDAPWFNPSGKGQQTPAGEPQLLYNNVDQPVWLIPMTSSSANDQSSTGVFLFNTFKNEGTFYPLSGVGIGNNVNATFQSTSSNIRNYDVASVQLYQLYNTPTWVAIYTRNSNSGDIYQAVGLVDARNLNGSNVQFSSTLSQGLQNYQQWLTQNTSSANRPTTAQKATVSAKVQRISSVQQGNNTVYYLQLQGQSQIFTANLSLSPKLPLVQQGDTIEGEYLNSGGPVVTFDRFDDTSINLGTGGSTTTTPTPAGTPKATTTAKATPTR